MLLKVPKFSLQFLGTSAIPVCVQMSEASHWCGAGAGALQGRSSSGELAAGSGTAIAAEEWARGGQRNAAEGKALILAVKLQAVALCSLLTFPQYCLWG